MYDEFLQLEPRSGSENGTYEFSRLLSWLIATVRPSLTVELGPGRTEPMEWTVDASAGGDALGQWSRGSAQAHGGRTEGFESEAHALAVLAGGKTVDLLHISLLDLDDAGQPDLDAWSELMGPGSAIVVTSVAANRSSLFAKATQLVADRYPSVRVPLGLTAEALVAQVPSDGAAPAVELLRNVPSAVGNLLALAQSEPLALLGEEPSALAVQAVLGQLLERHEKEREVFVSALRAYKELTAHLSAELADARDQLATQVDAARVERERLLQEFLDRLDVLSAKISTSAAKYTAELEDKERVLEERQQQVLAYAGQAATARSVIDDIYTSSSWRATAPLRIMSRLMARRRPPVPEN